jgi:hypothetical protein
MSSPTPAAAPPTIADFSKAIELDPKLAMGLEPDGEPDR